MPGAGSLELVSVSVKNLGYFELITSRTLQVSYSKKWYNEVAEQGDVGAIANYNGVPVGAICISFDHPNEIYIRTIGVLPSYRKRGVGTKLLEFAIETAKERGLEQVSAHVWTANEEGLKFYLAREFQEKSTCEKFYSKLQPSSAWHVVYSIV